MERIARQQRAASVNGTIDKAAGVFEIHLARRGRRESARACAGLRPREVGALDRHARAQAKSDQLNGFFRRIVTEHLAMCGVKIRFHRRERLVVEFSGGHLHRKLMVLPGVACVDGAQEIELGTFVLLAGECRPPLVFEFAVNAIDDCDAIRRGFAGHARAAEIRLQVVDQHAHCAQHARRGWHQHAGDAKMPCDGGRMHRPGAAERDQREIAGIEPALDRYKAHRVRHIGIRHGNNRRRRDHDLDLLRLRYIAFDGRIGTRSVYRERAAEQELRIQAPEHDVGIGDGRALAAMAVARGPRPRAGAVRADVQQAAGIEPGNAAAARADGMHVECRGLERAAIDHAAVAELRLAVLHEANIGTGAAHVERDDVGMAATRRHVDRAADAAAGPRKQRIDGALARLAGRHDAATRTHDERRRRNGQPRYRGLERAEIIARRRHQVGVDHGGTQALVFAEFRQHVGRDRHVAGGPTLAQPGGDGALVRRIGVGVQQANRDCFHALRQQAVDRRVQAVGVEGGDYSAVRRDALDNLLAQLARHQRRGLGHERIKRVRPSLACDFEQVAEPRRGDQARQRAFAFEQRIRQYRGAKADKSDLRAGAADLRQNLADAGQRRKMRLIRRG